jgi:hypothetical protein
MESKYSKKFIDVVNNSFINSNNLESSEKEFGSPYYVGFGNPNSKILILGKEKGSDINNFEQFNYESIENINEWKFYVDNATTMNLDRFYPNSHHYINAFTPYLHRVNSGHTWDKYTILVRNLIPEITNENNDFFKYSFISEINYRPSKYSNIKKFKDQRRIDFLKEDFFKSFNVTTLGCGDYLEEKVIEEIFDVKFDSNLSLPRQKLVIYKNNERIVINTRHLSIDVTNEYLDRVAEIARQYL